MFMFLIVVALPHAKSALADSRRATAMLIKKCGVVKKP
jgi:hypothetical protein